MKSTGNGCMQIGENIRSARREKQLTQAELAYRAGCSVRAVAALEKGDGSAPIALFLDICCALGCVPSELLEGMG